MTVVAFLFLLDVVRRNVVLVLPDAQTVEDAYQYINGIRNAIGDQDPNVFDVANSALVFKARDWQRLGPEVHILRVPVCCLID